MHFQSQSEEAPLINSSTSSEDGRQTPSLPEPGSSIELKKVRGSKLPSKDYDVSVCVCVCMLTCM